ncbi:MAG TPA: hypothetical protein VGI10_28575 [Polyangiaceae bacterium]
MRSVALFVLGTSFALIACGGSSSGGGSPGSGGSAASGGSSGSVSSGGASGGVTAGSGGASGSGGVSGSGVSGGGGAGGVITTSNGGACSGVNLTHTTTVLTAPATADLASPTLSPDELEMLYAVGLPSATPPQDTWTIHRATRVSRATAFDTDIEVPELDAACPGSNRRDPTLSSDGLSVYIVCEAPDADNLLTGPLRRATRANRDAPWAVDATDFGTVGTSPSITGDQLTLWTSSIATGQAAPSLFTRASIAAPFTNSTASINVPQASTPDISADGTLLFGADASKLLLSKRNASGSFDVINPDLLARATVLPVGSPTQSADCGSLYFIEIDTLPTAATVWTISVATP